MNILICLLSNHFILIVFQQYEDDFVKHSTKIFTVRSSPGRPPGSAAASPCSKNAQSWRSASRFITVATDSPNCSASSSVPATDATMGGRCPAEPVQICRCSISRHQGIKASRHHITKMQACQLTPTRQSNQFPRTHPAESAPRQRHCVRGCRARQKFRPAVRWRRW